MPKSFNYIFIDESGDPGKPYEIDNTGNKILSGASLFYILSAVCLDSKKLFALENRIMEIKNKYQYREEIKKAGTQTWDTLSLSSIANPKPLSRVIKNS